MRTRVLSSESRVRITLGVFTALLGALAIAGCGNGGGGGKPNPTPTTPTQASDPNLSTVTGTVTDNVGAAVAGAKVSVNGSSQSGTTGANGQFTILNVPVGREGLVVTSPSGYQTDTVQFQGNVYATSGCPIRVTTVKGATFTLPNSFILFPQSSTTPPAPPANYSTSNNCPQ